MYHSEWANQGVLPDTIDTIGEAMRDYILHESQSRAPRGLLGAMLRWMENWRARKDLRTLLRFSDYQLRDIGLTRADLRALLSRPADCDLMWELERQHRDADATLLRAKAAEPEASPQVQKFGNTAARGC
jgi:uncharacterized protein YjiS (DUF1127 family)